jgi:DNA polymerase V
MRSRSFGGQVTTFRQLEQALSEHLSNACQHLHEHHSRASFVTVSIRTSRFNERPQTYINSATIGLPESTNYLPDLMVATRLALKKIYRPHFIYKKAGIILSGLQHENSYQGSLWANSEPLETKKQSVMNALETINRRYGRRHLTLGVALSSPISSHPHNLPWHAQAHSLSPEYTTAWTDLPTVH